MLDQPNRKVGIFLEEGKIKKSEADTSDSGVENLAVEPMKDLNKSI